MLPVRRGFTLLLALTVGACGSTPNAPSGNGDAIVPLGEQVLRILSRCTAPANNVVPLVYTRVTVTRTSSEWLAASGGAGGDVQVRLHETGGVTLPGSLPVAGTMTGTAVHLPELFTQPGPQVRITFDGGTSLNGVAFAAGTFGAATGGVDGQGIGSLSAIADDGNTCQATSFSWSIFPAP
jgi:hypothetical protein